MEDAGRVVQVPVDRRAAAIARVSSTLIAEAARLRGFCVFARDESDGLVGDWAGFSRVEVIFNLG